MFAQLREDTETVGLHAFSALILWYVNHVSIKMFLKATCLYLFPNRKARAGSQKMTSTGLPGNSPQRVLPMIPWLFPEGLQSRGLVSSRKDQEEAVPWRP